jgi:hypothetical protein
MIPRFSTSIELSREGDRASGFESCLHQETLVLYLCKSRFFLLRDCRLWKELILPGALVCSR